MAIPGIIIIVKFIVIYWEKSPSLISFFVKTTKSSALIELDIVTQSHIVPSLFFSIYQIVILIVNLFYTYYVNLSDAINCLILNHSKKIF